MPFHRSYLIILCVSVLVLAVALGVTVVVTAAVHLRDRRRCCWKGEYSVSKLHTHCLMRYHGNFRPSTNYKNVSGCLRLMVGFGNKFYYLGKLQDVETKEVATVEFRSRRESKEEEEVIQV